MSKTLTITFALLIFCSIYDLTAQQLQIDVKEKTLENGVKVLVWERPSAGRVGARMFYKVDIAAERPGTVGLTHMLEHHLFKGSDLAGTRSWEEEEEIAREVELLERMITDERNAEKECHIQRDVFAETEAECRSEKLDSLEAALVNATDKQNELAYTTWYDVAVQSAGGTNSTASTGRDWMKFDIDLPAHKLELFMWTERSRVENPVFRHFEPEKEVVVDQIRRYDNRPDGAFSRVMRSMTYDAHPYGWAHWFSDLTRATREDHWEIFYKYFIPQNTIISIVGDVDAEEVFELAETYWGSWQKGRPSPRMRTVEPVPVGQKRLVVEAAAGPALALHVPMPAVGHEDAHVFDLFAELLGAPGGLIEQELIDNMEIATSASASSWTSKYPSHFEIRINLNSNNDLESAETAIQNLFEQVRAGNINVPDLEAARSRLILNLARQMDAIGSSAVAIGSMEAIYGWNHLNKIQKLWGETSVDDVARIAETYFKPSMQTVGNLVREGGETTSDVYNPDLSNTGLFGRHGVKSPDASSLDMWPVGGPVSELFSDPVEKKSAAAFMNKKGSSDKTNKYSEGEPAEPYAIAEQPWYAPPWMANRQPERFTVPMPVNDWRDLHFEQSDFTPPPKEEALITLENGFRAFVHPSELLPMVQVSLFVNTPEVGEPAGKEGISALISSLVRDGSRTVGDRNINTALNELGASISTNTDRKGVTYRFTAPSEAGPDLLLLIGSMISDSDFEHNFSSVQNRVAASADRSLESAPAALRSLFEENLFGNDHPYGRTATGESIRSITIHDVAEFYAEYYSPENMTLAISGPHDREVVRENLRESGLYEIQSGRAQSGRYFQLPVFEPAEERRVVTHETDTRQGHVMIGHEGIQGLPEDHAALEVMNYILSGGGFVSRMMELLRTQTGITSALFGEVEPGIHAKYPYLWRFSGNPETLAEGILLAINEIEKMKEHGVTEEEFEAARTAYIDGLIPASYDTPHKTAERMAYHTLHGIYAYQSPQYLNYYAGAGEELHAFRELTLEEVNRAARNYLHPERLLITIAGSIDIIADSASDRAKELLFTNDQE